jgi:hypothetical protein
VDQGLGALAQRLIAAARTLLVSPAVVARHLAVA